MKKSIKRILTALVGFPLVAILFIYGNEYMIDVAFSIVALLAIREYFHVFGRITNPVRWIRVFSSNIYSFYTCNSNEICIVFYRYVYSIHNLYFIYSGNSY